MVESTVRKWSRSGHFDLEQRESSSSFAVIKDYQIETLIEKKPSHTTQDISEVLHTFYMSFVTYFKTFGYVNHLRFLGL